MSTESEINISTIWDIFEVEIVPEAPGEKLISKSRWGKDEKRGDISVSSAGFLLCSLCVYIVNVLP